MEYTRLNKLIGEDFTVKEVQGYKWKMWLEAEGRMTVSSTYLEGHSKKWQVLTDKGLLDISDYQFGSMLAGVFDNGSANPIGKTFNVKSNGKQGKEVRYYINPVWDKKPDIDRAAGKVEPVGEIINNEVTQESLDDIPF